MNDLISRSAVLGMAYCAIKPTHDNPSIMSVVSVEDIEQLPTIEAEPVVHSEWTEEWQCKKCGNDAEFTEWTTEKRFFDANGNDVNVEYEVKRTYHLTKRCPNCGARMDAKGDGNAEETNRG